ncbi:hypothetical protein SDC9_122810 [bioreactor metagenome]|uniref:Uncharacterized protein n=1 Tax=bioreactor metagenome TaxID=1076179 RepID=A0A645CFP6_9ZZZZ
MGQMVCQFRKILFHIAHKRGTAGAHHKAFFEQLRALLLGYHVRAARGFRHCVKPQRAKARVHLTRPCIGKLALDRGRNHCIEFLPWLLVFQQVDSLENFGFVHDRAKGALRHAGTAGGTLALANQGALFLVHGDRPRMAGALTRALGLNDSVIRACFCAESAFDALLLINMRFLARV